jgi:hypothetical protein
MEDTSLKALCALVFAFTSFAAFAQAPDAATTAPYYFEHFFGELTEHTMGPTATVSSNPAMETLGEPADEAKGIAITGPDAGADVPEGLTHSSEETSTVGYATPSENNSDVTIRQGTTSAQIIDTEPAIEELGESGDEMGDLAITGPVAPADLPVGAISPPPAVNDGLDTAN